MDRSIEFIYPPAFAYSLPSLMYINYSVDCVQKQLQIIDLEHISRLYL